MGYAVFEFDGGIIMIFCLAVRWKKLCSGPMEAESIRPVPTRFRYCLRQRPYNTDQARKGGVFVCYGLYKLHIVGCAVGVVVAVVVCYLAYL